MNSKERLLATVRGEARDRVPVTPIVMQWAAHHIGRSYRDYYLDGRVLAAGQVAVARDFASDWVSVMSDPWGEASAFGMQFDWPAEGVGVPRGLLLNTRADVAKLQPFDPYNSERLAQRLACITAEKEAVGDQIAICGWVEGPIAEYADLRGLEPACMDLMDQPEMFHAAAEVIVESAIRLAKAQVDAGADMIGVGDAAASILGPELYVEHIRPWQRKLFDALHDMGTIVKLHICGNITALLPHLAGVGADILDIDHMVPLDQARAIMGDSVTLCGNFDPVSVLKDGPPQQIAAAARKCIAQAGGSSSRFILQPGCEVPAGTPTRNVQAFCPGPESLINDALRID
ncbi:MAG: uroporphyrinogen decarboxylase family protein [Phycisphaeraceae bacterium]